MQIGRERTDSAERSDWRRLSTYMYDLHICVDTSVESIMDFKFSANQ